MKSSVGSRNGYKPRRGALTAIVAILLASAVIRIGLNAGQVYAQATSNTVPNSDLEECSPTPDIQNVLAALAERDEQLKTREARISVEMAELKSASEEIEKKIQALKEAEDSLTKTLALADGAAEKDIDGLISVYEAMKPKDAALLFEEMTPDFAAGFLAKLKPDTAAAILAGMTPKAAYSLSAIIAGRNSSVPKD